MARQYDMPSTRQRSRGEWRLIDTAYFAAGNDQYVRLTAGSLSGSGNISRADAVMLEPVDFGDFSKAAPSPPNGRASSGAWSVSERHLEGAEAIRARHRGDESREKPMPTSL